MVRMLVAPILLSVLALLQQFDPTGRWIHKGPIGEVILDLRADKGYELKFPGFPDTTGTWRMRENHVVLTPAESGRSRLIDISSIGKNQVRIDIRNGMAMEFVRAGAKVARKPKDKPEERATEAPRSGDPAKLYGGWYWESGDDDMTLEIYPDGTYYFDYWIGDDEYDSEGTYKYQGDELILTPEEDGAVVTLAVLEVQAGKKLLIRLAYGREYWLDLDEVIEPDER